MDKSKLVNFNFFINPDKASVEQDENTETMNVQVNLYDILYLARLPKKYTVGVQKAGTLHPEETQEEKYVVEYAVVLDKDTSILDTKDNTYLTPQDKEQLGLTDDKLAFIITGKTFTELNNAMQDLYSEFEEDNSVKE